MIIQLSDGCQYDPRTMKHTVFVKDKPWPHNRQECFIYMMKVKRMEGLTDSEMDFLIEETQRSYDVSLNLRGVAGVEDYKLRAWKKMFNDKDHKVGLYRQLCVEYSEEPLDILKQLMFNDWLIKYRPNQYHALYSRRLTLPGVMKTKQRRNNKVSRKRTRCSKDI